MSLKGCISFLVCLVLCLFLSTPAYAGAEVKFGWDANSEDDLAGYRLYQSKVSGVYVKGQDKAVATILKGSEETTLSLSSGGTYYWVLTAYDTSNNESGFSNEVTETFNWSHPSPPSGFSIQVTVNVNTN